MEAVRTPHGRSRVPASRPFASRGRAAATITIAQQSPRGSMAPLHAAARRAVEYFDEAPLMEPDSALPRERPSLLAYNRPTWRAMAPPAAPLAKTRYSQSPSGPYVARDSSRISHAHNGYATDDDERSSEDRSSFYTSDEDSPYYAHPRLHPQFDELGGLDEETKDVEATHDDDDEEVDLLEAPKPADVPLLEIDEEDPEQDVDTILGDLTRLPRTTIIDENGFLVDPRASLSHPAAIGAMGLGVSRPGVVIKSGLLFKQGFGFLNGGWKVRHVELTSTTLTFFKGEHGRKRGEIDLATCSLKSIEIMPRDSVFDGAQATMWRFAIRTKGRRILMSAYSEADMKEWLRCLHVALAVQSSGAGRYTDLVVPNGTLLANKGDGLMRASGSGLLR